MLDVANVMGLAAWQTGCNVGCIIEQTFGLLTDGLSIRHEMKCESDIWIWISEDVNCFEVGRNLDVLERILNISK